MKCRARFSTEINIFRESSRSLSEQFSRPRSTTYTQLATNLRTRKGKKFKRYRESVHEFLRPPILPRITSSENFFILILPAARNVTLTTSIVRPRTFVLLFHLLSWKFSQSQSECVSVLGNFLHSPATEEQKEVI